MNIVYIAVVAVILLLPAVRIRLKKELRVENRAAEKFPDLSLKKLPAAPRQFERWFGDRFGGREQYIGLVNDILYHLFHESPCEQLIVGRHGFIFLGSNTGGVDSRDSLINLLFVFDRAKVERAATDFISRLPQVERIPAKVVFLNLMSKHYLNFAELPAAVQKMVPDPGRLFSAEVEKEVIRRRPEAARYFVKLRPEAERAAAKMQLIPPRNYHWIPGPYTHLAADVAARHLGVTGRTYVPKREDYRYTQVRSDLRQFVSRGLKTPALVTEERDFLRLGITTVRGISKIMPEILPRSPVLEKRVYRSVNPAAPGGKLLLIGNSFTNPLCRDMARYFREVISLEYTAIRLIDKSRGRDALRKLFARWHPEYIVVVSHVNACDFVEFLTDVLPCFASAPERPAGGKGI